jgi:hypothetical protein
MPKNGYWIECVPLGDGANGAIGENLYSASMESFPDVHVTAPSPDQAIEKLRAKLKALRRYYRMTGKLLPELDNPVRPPSRLRSVHGWISVYVQAQETL